MNIHAAGNWPRTASETNSLSGITLIEFSTYESSALNERVFALEREKCDLQKLLCQLLRENEELRAQVRRHRAEAEETHVGAAFEGVSGS